MSLETKRQSPVRDYIFLRHNLPPAPTAAIPTWALEQAIKPGHSLAASASFNGVNEMALKARIVVELLARKLKV